MENIYKQKERQDEIIEGLCLKFDTSEKKISSELLKRDQEAKKAQQEYDEKLRLLKEETAQKQKEVTKQMSEL